MNLIKFKNMVNTRSLGNYKTSGGKTTLAQYFIRSDAPHNATDEEIEQLLSLGVTRVIDLRFDDELQKRPNPFAKDPRVRYCHVSLLSENVAYKFKSGEFGDIGDMYTYIMKERGEKVAEVFHMLAEEPGTVFYHCAEGKDRTGVISALLLMLAGVSEADVVENYRLSTDLWAPYAEEKTSLYGPEVFGYTLEEYMDRFFRSHPRFIQKMIDYIRENYETSENYLVAYGVTQEELEIIKQKLIGIEETASAKKFQPYNFAAIEKKWRKKLEDGYINKPNGAKPKFYCLDMFPYPSSSGLHVGHWRGYVLSDVVSRYKILRGFEIIHPMGWDAFGLPAENYAIKIGGHPEKVMNESVATFKRQLKEIGAVYDWSREISTIDPAFYKWTQWIFIQMFKNGLAYEKEMPLNWCPNCKAVLANEEAKNGVCDRCGASVTKKPLRQWMLKITNYADRLLSDLKTLEWPEKVKKMQTDWIGKSYGAEVEFKINGSDEVIKVFTTRPDTLYGATFMVLAPELDLAKTLPTPSQKEAVAAYVKKALAKSSVDRMADKEKTGVATGAFAINPMTGKLIPIWVSDYVLTDYGTGAIMCVPAHDERDFEFAKKFDLPIVQVLSQTENEESDLTEAFVGDGVLINSGDWNGLRKDEAIEAAINTVEARKIGSRKINFKLRDWVFSRQRYWGEPIPILHCPKCGAVPVDEKDLPVTLPDVERYQPTETGESPLADISEWVNQKCPSCGGPAKRETNTMPQWAGSSWYFLRYLDPRNDNELASQESLERAPVDMYVGGIEHAILHLLYARFYTKFLYDIKVLKFEEPFKILFNQGMILRKGKKMSKSEGNVISPDDLVNKYGCDSLRMYELFVGPPELDMEWNDNGIDGVYRFINKTWKLINENAPRIVAPNKDLERARHKAIYDITTRIENLSMNTVVSGLMETVNAFSDLAKTYGGLDRESLETVCVLLAPLAPNVAEEMWEILGHDKSVFEEKWPEYDEEKMRADENEIAVQLNGKYRVSVMVPSGSTREFSVAEAKNALGKRLDGLNIVKEIYVKDKLVNIVARPA